MKSPYKHEGHWTSDSTALEFIIDRIDRLEHELVAFEMANEPNLVESALFQLDWAKQERESLLKEGGACESLLSYIPPPEKKRKV